jgi:hypothetical protein
MINHHTENIGVLTSRPCIAWASGILTMDGMVRRISWR